MQKTCLLFLLAGAALLCGCDRQAKINSQKIDILSQKIVQLQQAQSSQMMVLQSELTSLAPMLDKMNDTYFEKNRDDALFFHTNTLFLLLTIGKQIESQLEAADAERKADSSLLFGYHTNQLDTMVFCTLQIENAMTTQESNIEDQVNAETRQVGTAVGDELLDQMKSLAPDPDETARRRKLEADVAQMQRDLDAIKARLEITNDPTLH
jgi:hypothetical protein